MTTPSHHPEMLDGRDASGPRPAATSADELALLIDGATNYAIYMLDPEGRVTGDVALAVRAIKAVSQ